MTSNSPPKMPSVYIPHGGGPAFFMTGPMADAFASMGRFLGELPSLLPAKPRAIAVVTAHWETPVVTVGTRSETDLYFDYWGFPEETYRLTYPAPRDLEVAHRIATLLDEGGVAVATDAERPLDHGVFIPLMKMFPEADIPVIPISLRQDLDPAAHLEIGRAIAPLRDDGVLIIGSGLSYHNLGALGSGGPATEASVPFHAWLDATLTGDDIDGQLQRWTRAPLAREVHPRAEHLLPLMVVAGTRGDDTARRIYTDTVMGAEVGAWSFG